MEDALNYPEGCQFLFFGNDYLVLSYQRVIIISTPNIKLPVIYVASEENIGKGKLVSKCITEVDGLRVLTNEGVSLISKVPKELYNISDEFSKSASKRLIDIYIRRGVSKNTVYHIKEAYKLKEYFDGLLGYNVYDLFPDIKI